jgi:hypothetical protein
MTDGMQHSMDLDKDDTTGFEEQSDVQGATVGDELTEASEATPEAPRPGAEEVAEHIRTDSRAAALTDPAVFAEEPFSLDEEELARVMGDLAEEDAYADIVRTADERSGVEYLHSTTFLTVVYAMHLIRARADDPAYLIVQTVREYSEIYPKPTSLEFFELDPFGLKPDDVRTCVKAILADEAYADIKPVTVSNGMVYLFSDRWLSEAQAQAMAQWVEVDMHLDSNQ